MYTSFQLGFARVAGLPVIQPSPALLNNLWNLNGPVVRIEIHVRERQSNNKPLVLWSP